MEGTGGKEKNRVEGRESTGQEDKPELGGLGYNGGKEKEGGCRGRGYIFPNYASFMCFSSIFFGILTQNIQKREKDLLAPIFLVVRKGIQKIIILLNIIISFFYIFLVSLRKCLGP